MTREGLPAGQTLQVIVHLSYGPCICRCARAVAEAAVVELPATPGRTQCHRCSLARDGLLLIAALDRRRDGATFLTLPAQAPEPAPEPWPWENNPFDLDHGPLLVNDLISEGLAAITAGAAGQRVARIRGRRDLHAVADAINIARLVRLRRRHRKWHVWPGYGQRDRS